MLPVPELDIRSEQPLYRQLADHIKECVRKGILGSGDRLPATRELAGLLGLNRTTISAAYTLLEEEGLVQGQVGRGSFILGRSGKATDAVGSPWSGVDWDEMLAISDSGHATGTQGSSTSIPYSFVSSQPLSEIFPLEEFRACCDEVTRDASIRPILQLGSPGGYEPLRRYLLDQFLRDGIAGPGDDAIVVNGCQQGMDLLARVLSRPGDGVVLEDPVYPGLRSVFARSGARILGAPVGHGGIDIEAVARLVAVERPRLVVVTPNFQNPTGETMDRGRRQALLESVRHSGAVLVENDVYGRLRYLGDPVAPLKSMTPTGDVVLVGSFSKIAFPGLRVGWVIAPAALVSRLAEAKQWTDLHTDQLSQAVLYRFAVTGRLEDHVGRILKNGREQLRATLDSCEKHLPKGAVFTHPEGGMNVWVRLPEPLDAQEVLEQAHREGVGFLPGRLFTILRDEPGALRLSFGGLPPEAIREGIGILGRVCREVGGRSYAGRHYQPSPAVV